MASRLVLWCGALPQSVLADLPADSDDLAVLAADDSRVSAFREEGIRAERCDLSDQSVFAEFDPDSVFVAGDDADRNRTAAEAARGAYPDVHLVVYGRDDGRFDDVADAVVDPGAVIADRVLDLTTPGPRGDRAGFVPRRLQSTLRSLSGPLAVVMHDNPDPDAIGSAVALSALAERTGLAATPCYFGDINHQENRAMVNLLDLELRNFDSPSGIEAFGSVAFVDHSRPGVNDQLPPETTVDVVVDHHPPQGPVEADFVDLRQDVGATSSILGDYYRRLEATPGTAVATALLFGVRIDTDDFVREARPLDFEVAASLVPDADPEVLDRIENPRVSADTLETIAAAVRNRRVEESVLASYVGDLSDRDALAQAADLLLGMAGIETTLVFGTRDDTVYVSARARGGSRDLGVTLRTAFGQIGSAGGHAEMAGAQIPIGALSSLPTPEGMTRDDVLRTVVAERFLETIDAAPRSVEDYGQGPTADEYGGEADG
ncbi:MAG: bifunctional oligoribonuclease/PAP phosphatase NrnA [Halobacteriales archaeon]